MIKSKVAIELEEISFSSCFHLNVVNFDLNVNTSFCNLNKLVLPFT